MKKILSLFKKKWFWVFIVVLGVGGVVLARGGSRNVPEFSSGIVERKDLFQTVSETGSVVANLELNYGWETAGRVASTTKQVGDIVAKGDLIAVLEDTKQRAALNEALSSLASAQAKLSVELAGPSTEAEQKSWASVEQARASLKQSEASLEKAKAKAESDVVAAEKGVETAQNNLQLASGGENSQIVNDAYEDLINTLKSAITTLSDALTESDNVLGVDNTLANDAFEAYLSALNPTHLGQSKLSYQRAKSAKISAENSVFPLSMVSDHGVVDAAVAEVQYALSDMRDHLTDVQLVLDATLPLGDFSQSELDTIKTSIAVDKASVDTATASVTNAKQSVTTARNSLYSYQIAYDQALATLATTRRQVMADIAIAEAAVESARATLREREAAHNDLVNPPRAVDVASLRAEVSRQSANLDRIRDELEKTKLLALGDGVLAVFDVEVGETVGANQVVVTIVSPALTVEVDISESDIAKVSHGDPVRMTLDAFGEDVEFAGSVASIDPAETEISGVIYYKTKIAIHLDGGEDVRPGMTANVSIMTDMSEDALVIPRRAILERDGKRFVRVLTDPKTASYEERAVSTGLRGDDGEIEILSGLQEGEEVITFIREEE
jgi:RND family efflux transporter MFP subunit